MLLDLSEEHREHLAFLPRVDRAGEGARRRRRVPCGPGRVAERPALRLCWLPLQWSPSLRESRWSSCGVARTPRSTKALPVRTGRHRSAVCSGKCGPSLSPWGGRASCDSKGFSPLWQNQAEGLLGQRADPARALNTEFFKACVFWRVMDTTPSARDALILTCTQLCGIVR